MLQGIEDQNHKVLIATGAVAAPLKTTIFMKDTTGDNKDIKMVSLETVMMTIKGKLIRKKTEIVQILLNSDIFDVDGVLFSMRVDVLRPPSQRAGYIPKKKKLTGVLRDMDEFLRSETPYVKAL